MNNTKPGAGQATRATAVDGDTRTSDTAILVALYGYSPTLAETEALLKTTELITVPDEILEHLKSLRTVKK